MPSLADNRRRALLVLALAAGVAAAAAGLSSLGNPSSPRAGSHATPNVLIFYTDDQRKRGTMGQMPQTRRIFGRGVNFPQAFVVTPQCCPARAALLSGRYQHNHKVRNNGATGNFDHSKSWPRDLRRAGYRTAFHGKYLHGFRRADLPNFDVAANPQSRRLAEQPLRHDRVMANRTTKFITNTNKPWLAVLSFRAPHYPFQVQPKYRDLRVGKLKRTPAVNERDFSDKNPALAAARARPPMGKISPEEIRRRQLRMLRTTDNMIARVWARLEATGQARNTLAIFTSDNGYYWGEHGGLRGKFLPYLDSVRTPLMVRWDRGLDSGADRRFALDIDIGPTVLDATGVTPSYRPDGRSLVDPSWNRKWVMFEGSNRSTYKQLRPWERAYYDGKRHYFRWEDGFRELYRLDRDPWQLDNALRSKRFAGSREAQRRTARLLQSRLDEASTCRGAQQCP